MSDCNAITYSYMSNKQRFADAINFSFYGGREVVLSEKLEDDESHETLIHQQGTMERYHDIMKRAVLKHQEEQQYALFSIENQTKECLTMPLRCLIYDALRLDRAFKDIAAQNCEHKTPDMDYLTKLRPSDRVPPVMTLVIFWSPDSWTGPTTLQELMTFSDNNLRQFVPDYHMNLLQPSELNEKDLHKFNSALGKALNYVKLSADKTRLLELVRSDQFFNAVDLETGLLLSAVTNTKLNLESNNNGGINMCKAIEDIKAEGLAEGRAEERDIAIVNVINSMRSLNLPYPTMVQLLKSSFALTDEQIATRLAH